MSGWIKCSERMPEKVGVYWSGPVLIRNTLLSDVLLIAIYSHQPGWKMWHVKPDGNGDLLRSQVTHWMPLPDPPKE